MRLPLFSERRVDSDNVRRPIAVAARRVSSRPSHPLRTSAVSSLRSCAEPSEIALRGRATSVYTCEYVCVCVCVCLFLSLPLTLFFPLLVYHFLLLSHTARPSTNFPSTRDADARLARRTDPFALPGRELRRRTGRRAPEKKKFVSLARRRRRRRRCERFTLPSARCAGPRSNAHGRTKIIARGRPPRPFSLLFLYTLSIGALRRRTATD